MEGRIEGFLEKGLFKTEEGLDFFDVSFDLKELKNDDVEIRFKNNGTVEILGGGLCITYPNERVKIIYE